MKTYLKNLLSHLKTGLYHLVFGVLLAYMDMKGIKTFSGLFNRVVAKKKPAVGEVHVSHLVCGSEWRTPWGDEFIVKTKESVHKEYSEVNTRVTYIYMMTTEEEFPKSRWPYRHNIPHKIKPVLIRGLLCLNTEEEYAKLSKQGDQHD